MRDEGRPFAWLPLVAISFCLAAHTVALSSLLTYMGVFVQYLLDLPSLNASGETVYAVTFAPVRVGFGLGYQRKRTTPCCGYHPDSSPVRGNMKENTRYQVQGSAWYAYNQSSL